MTARHAGQLTPTDTWLTDQLAGWIAQFDAHASHVMTTANPDDSEAMVIARALWIMDQQCELLLTVRQLVTEVLTRG